MVKRRAMLCTKVQSGDSDCEYQDFVSLLWRSPANNITFNCRLPGAYKRMEECHKDLIEEVGGVKYTFASIFMCG